MSFSMPPYAAGLGLAVAATTTEKTGNISSNENWSGIIHITGDVFILTTVEVTVAAGTQVLFADDYKIEVHGQLQAVGTSGSRITFANRGDNPTGSWFGIIMGEEVDAFNIDPPDSGSFFKYEYCDFSDGTKGSRDTIGHRGRTRGGALMAQDVRGGLTIDNCTFTACTSQENGGATFIQCESLFTIDHAITNCTFTDCIADTDDNTGFFGGGFMMAHPDDVTLTNNTFSGCTGGSQAEDVPVTVANASDEITVPGAHGLITGNGVVFGGTAVPSGLTAGVEYYVDVTSSTKFKPCSTIANAVAGTPINLTDDGTAVTITILYDWYIFDLQGTVTIT